MEIQDPSLAGCVTLLNTSKCQFPLIKVEITPVSLSVVEDSHLAQGLLCKTHATNIVYYISMARLVHGTRGAQ